MEGRACGDAWCAGWGSRCGTSLLPLSDHGAQCPHPARWSPGRDLALRPQPARSPRAAAALEGGIDSRLDIALTVEADRPQPAIALATAYAKAVRRAIPDDEGLPTRGRGAGRAEGGLGPFRWPLIGALLGLGLNVALAIVGEGLRRGSARAPRRAGSSCARARRVTQG
jgi:hypothetical protein